MKLIVHLVVLLIFYETRALIEDNVTFGTDLEFAILVSCFMIR